MKNCVLLSIYDGKSSFFEKGLLITLKSLRKTNPNIPVAVFYRHLTRKQKKKLKGCMLVEMSDSPEFRCGKRKDVTDATFYRFHLGILEKFEKVLYLDCDTVVLGSLDGLFRLKGPICARGNKISLASDFTNTREIEKNEKIKEGDVLLNAGVLCVDREFWVKENIKGKAVELIKRYGMDSFRNPDQSILNIIAYEYGGFTSIPAAYNYCRWPDMKFSRFSDTKINSKGVRAPWVRGAFVKILHWNGSDGKPWNYYSQIAQIEKKYYLNCYLQFRTIIARASFFIQRKSWKLIRSSFKNISGKLPIKKIARQRVIGKWIARKKGKFSFKS